MITNVTLNSVSLAAALDGHAFTTDINRPLSGEIRAQFVDVPGRDGAWTFDEEEGDIAITIGVHIWADDIDERRAAVNALRAWARTPTGRVPLIISDEPDRFWEAKLDSAPPMVDELVDGQTVLVYSCRPYALATETSEEPIAASGSPDSGTFELVLPFPADPIIQIVPTNGTITSLVYTLNGSEVAWQSGTPGNPHTVPEDGTITINTIAQVVLFSISTDIELTGAFDVDDVDMANVAISGFPQLEDGTNSWALTWTGTATTVDIDIEWRERFI